MKQEKPCDSPSKVHVKGNNCEKIKGKKFRLIIWVIKWIIS